MTQPNRPTAPTPNTTPVVRRRSNQPQSAAKLSAPQRLTIRTALAAGATIATLIGAQNLVFLDKLNTLAASMNPVATTADTASAASGAIDSGSGTQSPVLYTVPTDVPTDVPTTIPTIVVSPTTIPTLIATATVYVQPTTKSPNILMPITATVRTIASSTPTATIKPSATATTVPSKTPTPIPTVKVVQQAVVVPAYSQPRPKSKSS